MAKSTRCAGSSLVCTIRAHEGAAQKRKKSPHAAAVSAPVGKDEVRFAPRRSREAVWHAKPGVRDN
jgi:hypothetical protein